MTRANLVVGLGIVLCATSLFWLERRFVAADHRKAEALMAGYAVAHRNEPFGHFLARAHGGHAGDWETETVDDCRGVVRARWRPRNEPATAYSWDVMVSTKEIFATPSSPEGASMLERFKAEASPLPPLELPRSASDAAID